MGPPKPQVQKLKRQENLARCKRSVLWFFSPLAGNSVWFNDALILLFACIISVHSLCEQRRHFTNVWTSIEYNETYHIWLSWKKKIEQDSLHQNPKKREEKHTQRMSIHTHHTSGHLLHFDGWFLVVVEKRNYETNRNLPRTHTHAQSTHIIIRQNDMRLPTRPCSLHSDISSIFATPNM